MSGDYTFPNLIEPVAEWTDIPQLESDTPATGGAGMPANAQAQALANRVEYLSNIVDGAIQWLNVSSDESADYPGKALVYWDLAQGLKASLNLSMGSGGAVVGMPTGLWDGAELTLVVSTRANFLAFDPGFQFGSGVGNTFFTSQSDGASAKGLFRFVYAQGSLIGTAVITDAIDI